MSRPVHSRPAGGQEQTTNDQDGIPGNNLSPVPSGSAVPALQPPVSLEQTGGMEAIGHDEEGVISTLYMLKVNCKV